MTCRESQNQLRGRYRLTWTGHKPAKHSPKIGVKDRGVTTPYCQPLNLDKAKGLLASQLLRGTEALRPPNSPSAFACAKVSGHAFPASHTICYMDFHIYIGLCILRMWLFIHTNIFSIWSGKQPTEMPCTGMGSPPPELSFILAFKSCVLHAPLYLVFFLAESVAFNSLPPPPSASHSSISTQYHYFITQVECLALYWYYLMSLLF